MKQKTKVLFLSVFLGTTIVVAASTNAENSESGQVWANTKNTGAIAIPAQFSNVMPFYQGLAAVEMAGKWGAINKTGQFQISPQFDYSFAFEDGLAGIHVGGPHGKAGVIDRSGAFVINPQYDDETITFLGDYAGVTINSGAEAELFYINRKGERIPDSVATSPANPKRYSLPKGYYSNYDNRTQNSGITDSDHNFISERRFDYLDSFDEGLAAYCLDGYDCHYKNGLHGYVDTDGNTVIKPQFNFARSFSEGLAAVRVGDEKNGAYGYINHLGKYVISPKFNIAYDFSEGLGEVCVGQKCGFIDSSGRLVIPMKFDAQCPEGGFNFFHEGLASVCINGKWGYISR